MRPQFVIKPLSVLIALITLSPILSSAAPAQSIAQQQQSVAQQLSVNISSGSLTQALNQLARLAGEALSFSPKLVSGKTTQGVTGRYTLEQALQQLLVGTELTALKQGGNGGYILAPSNSLTSPDTIQIPTLTIEDSGLSGYQRDEIGYDDVYDKNSSTAYMGKVEIERYKGTTPSDLLQGVAGVFSGESRNSGALDVNIRGIQGPGRVPVIIDGTEQALTVWRGYNGASNRSYIDPNLISSIQIYKGATNERDVNSGIGGAMVVTTLQPADIIKEGEDVGFELKIEGSSNAVDARVPKLHTGEHYSTVDGFPQGPERRFPYVDETLRVDGKTKTAKDLNPLTGNDYSYRLAAAKKMDKFDVLAAYAYRERGNYFTGKNNADYYNSDQNVVDSERDAIRTLASYWLPGNEMTNSSSMMESWLLKGTWHIADDQKLGLNFRHSNSVYGEIMPSRIDNVASRAYIQWPLSEVTAQAYNLDYRYKPVENKWIDLNATLWQTDTESDTYTGAGFPNQVLVDTSSGSAVDIDGILRNSSETNAKNTRNGVNLSNKINLSNKLDLTVGGRFQGEKLSSDDETFARAGRRQKWDGTFDFAWKANKRLNINAGMNYSSYRAFDDALDETGGLTQSQITSYDVKYDYKERLTKTDQDITDEIANLANIIALKVMFGYPAALGAAELAAGTITIQNQDRTYFNEVKDVALGNWQPDGDGHYDRANNPCLNGTVPKSTDDVTITSCTSKAVQEQYTAKAKTRKDHGWVPHLTAAYEFTDDSRGYFKYAETLRYPSMFESTIAFSASISLYDVKPEHAYNWEIGYIHDLTQWFSDADYADIKLTYYDNLTKNVIERDNNFKFSNVDKQKIRGVELDLRYDSGRFFTNLGLNYVLKNEICDENSAALISAGSTTRAMTNPLPTCFDYGFPGGYQLVQATPKLSVTWSLGGRFLQQRLELGSRVTYHKAYENNDLDYYIANATRSSNNSLGQQLGYTYAFNTAYSWDDTFILDAYARYNINDDLIVELTGTNLSDQYYVDPATRSAMAAPGRTLKVSLTAKF